jgi:hypothetical protein
MMELVQEIWFNKITVRTPQNTSKSLQSSAEVNLIAETRALINGQNILSFKQQEIP